MKRIQVIDSHTGGEPTRVIVGGGPDLGSGTVAEQAAVFAEKFDFIRSAVVNEPRGSDVLVGALLLPPSDPAATAGVIFFNNVGFLGMCGHGTIGLIATLAWLGKIQPGEHVIETVVGPVTARLFEDGRVSVTNVLSWRKAANVSIDVPGIGTVIGDVAWGGNWFFLVKESPGELCISNVELLTEQAWKIRLALNAGGYPEIDHVEFFGPSADPKNHSRNFVLCPGKAYDRSPCGTGTSAKLACLAADGKLAPGEIWRQESVIGSVFEGSYQWSESGSAIPTITGQAWVTGETTLLLNDSDPFRHGIASF